MYEAKYSTNNIGGRCRRNRTVIAPCYNYITGRLPMLRKTFALLAGASLLAAASAAHANSLSQDSGQTVAAKPAATESEKLKALFAQSDEDNLKRNPISALFRGDERCADQLGDYITDEYFAAERAAAEKELAALQGIDRSKLGEIDQIAYDVFMRDK